MYDLKTKAYYKDCDRNFLLNVEEFIKHDMVDINTSSMTDVQKLEQLSYQVSNFISRIKCIEFEDEDFSRYILYLLGFLLSSIERHSQMSGKSPGDAIKNINNLTKLLVELAEVANHPPRDTIYSFSLWNTKDSLTFTGDEQEKFFIEVVADSTECLYSAVNIYESMRKGIDQENINSLLGILDKIVETGNHFRRFLKKNEKGELPISPNFFLEVLRQYNCSWVINDEIWEGPTAANCVPYICLDYILGVSNNKYNSYINSKCKYFTREDQELLDRVKSSKNLFTRITDFLFDNRVDLIKVEDSELREVISKNAVVYQYVKLYYQVAYEFYKLSRLHFGLIHRYMIRSDFSDKAMIIDRDKGVSGMTIDDVKEIREMRSNIPFMKIFKNVL